MKELLLAKSNIRKAKGLTIGLILLIMLASCFFNIVLILNTDYNKNAENNAKKINAGDAFIVLAGDAANITDDDIKKFITDDVEDYEISRQLGNSESLSVQFGEGTVSPNVTFIKENEAFNHKYDTNEVIEKDSSITEKFVYLPYVFYTGGGYKVGDNYELKIGDTTYNLKIKGFINNLHMGSHNIGLELFVVSDDIYTELEGKVAPNITINFDLKDGVEHSKFINKFSKEITKEYPRLVTFISTQKSSIDGRTFVAVIFGALFIAISLIIVVIVLLMLSNNISNYIKENIKTLGAIKALGYTNRNIRVAFLTQFLIVAVIGSIIGIGCSYALAPVITGMLSSQSGFPYEISFNVFVSIITCIVSILIVILSVSFFIRKANKIAPITALREGLSTHTFKKNRIKLEKTKLPVNISLALKTMFFNMKQNIATFIIVFFLVYMGVIGLVLYQNFAVEPKLSLLSFELCDGAIGIVDGSLNEEIYNYMNNMNEIENLRLVLSTYFNVGDARVLTYVLDDSDNLKNKDACYEGRLPKYENEVALSGKLCDIYGYNIGDEVTVSLGDKDLKYIISGFIQTANNNGSEGVILEKGADKLLPEGYGKCYYFETNGDTAKCIKNVEDKYGEKVVSYNFEELISGSISIFKTISAALVILILIISVLIILLVLYLLIKTLINNKKKDYGILKALGYTSSNIILQNAISFMPTIILSVVISSIISYFIVNPSICLLMNSFGIMKLTFTVPVKLMGIMGIGFVVVSFIIAVMLSRKIKKIEPYKLLTEE